MEEKENRAQTVGQQWMDDNQPERMIDEDCLEPSGSSPHKGNIWEDYLINQTATLLHLLVEKPGITKAGRYVATLVGRVADWGKHQFPSSFSDMELYILSLESRDYFPHSYTNIWYTSYESLHTLTIGSKGIALPNHR